MDSIDSYTRNMINTIANEVRRTYNIDVPIISFNNLINKLNGQLKEVDSLNIYETSILEKRDESFTIYILKNLNDEHKKFRIAHELGHLFIHMGYKIDNDLWNNSNDIIRDIDSREFDFQANEFASQLLMPKSKFKEIMYKYYNGEYFDMEKVTDYFKVSLEAVNNRAKWLNLIRW